MATTPDISNEQLANKLKEILESWPLYREYRYAAANDNMLPHEISYFCKNAKCRKEQLWKKVTPKTQTGFHIRLDKAGWASREYTCKNCDTNTIRFYYFWRANTDTVSTFFKAGQYPSLQKEPPERLAKMLDEFDLDLYRKALTSRNNAYGLGALAYLRRIVENRMNDLLELLHQAAKNDASAAEELKKIEDVKKSWRFDDKIGYAARLLPKHLRPDGSNPIDQLHDLASEGIHHRTEDECLEIFDRCKTAFEYVFQNLDVQIEDAKAYIASLKQASKPRN